MVVGEGGGGGGGGRVGGQRLWRYHAERVYRGYVGVKPPVDYVVS